VAEQRAGNIHVHDGISEADFVAMRTTRDKTLAMPTLLLPSVQVNVRAGRLPGALRATGPLSQAAPRPALMATSQTATDGLAGRWARYRQGPLGDDLLAAVVVTILLVPQSLAYAMLAGLPPSVGVMASLLPIVAYAALGSSATLAVGPVAVLAVMTAQAIGGGGPAGRLTSPCRPGARRRDGGRLSGCRAATPGDAGRPAGGTGAPRLHDRAVLLIALGQLPALLGLPLKGNTALELGQAFIKMDHPSAHPATALVGLLSLATCGPSAAMVLPA
jgi:SulP family sulfate permease